MFNRKSIAVLTCLLAIAAVAVAVSVQDNSLQVKSDSQKIQQRSSVPEMNGLMGDAVKIVPGEKPFIPTAKATVCNAQWQGTPTTVLPNWFTGLEYYAIYQDPVEVGCPGGTTYPFRVDTVFWHVFNSAGAEFDINLQPVIFAVDDSDPLCLKPGEVCCYGPLYTVTVPVGGGGAIVALPMDSGCCVDGPYFAGVWAPDFIGTGILGVVVDSAGSPSPFGNRVCANYNNYQGAWEDLIVDYSFPGNVLLWSNGAASDMNSCDDCAQIIEPGVDLWETPPGSFDNHFSVNPIPADFFDPGSDPFK